MVIKNVTFCNISNFVHFCKNYAFLMRAQCGHELTSTHDGDFFNFEGNGMSYRISHGFTYDPKI